MNDKGPLSRIMETEEARKVLKFASIMVLTIMSGLAILSVLGPLNIAALELEPALGVMLGYLQLGLWFSRSAVEGNKKLI